MKLTPPDKTTLGIVLTLLYVAAILFVRWPFELATLAKMPINSLGDALTGLVGPVALLWIVLGYLQQGDELRQNTSALRLQSDELRLQREELKQNGDALRLQAEELKHAVEQHKEMVATTKESLEFERQARAEDHEQLRLARRPSFILHLPKPEGIFNDNGEPVAGWTGLLEVATSNACDVICHCLTRPVFFQRATSVLRPGDTLHFQWESGNSESAFPERVEFLILFQDSGGDSYIQYMLLVRQGDGKPFLNKSVVEASTEESRKKWHGRMEEWVS